MSELVKIDSLRTLMLQDHGILIGDEGIHVEWCYSNNANAGESWSSSAISISGTGQLLSNYKDVIISDLQSASIQLMPTISPPIISITPYNGSTKRTYIKTEDEYQFDRILASLLIWTNMKPAGISKKWKFKKSIVEDDKFYGNELLVCRFKVYGPLPTKMKNFKTADGPKVPLSNSESNNSNNTREGWFRAMGHLKPNGVLDLLLESDGSLLYSINISILFNSEIRQVDHSIFQNSNILYLGIIHDLRSLNSIKPVELQVDQTKDFILSPSRASNKHDLQNYASTSRILLEFPLHIDLEDWFVTLSSFTKREYIADTRNFNKPKELRSLQKIQLDIVEAKFDDDELYHKKKVYTELMLWNSPWFRTSIVETYRNNPFWREKFNFDLPISTQYFQLVIKESVNDEDYGHDDPIIGTSYITPDMLDSLHCKEIDKLMIYDAKNSSIGRIFINLNQHQYFILAAEEYRVFEKMIVSIPFEELIEFVKPLAGNADELEEYSIMLVDVFQTLNKENEWFLALMDHELLPVDSLIRNNRMKGAVSNKTSNVFNTLFRGNSMLTKSLEKYNFRVGQEYLEKTIGEFVNKVSVEALDCEVDPRMIEGEDEVTKAEILKDHTAKLMAYVEELWGLIFQTSNDVPAPIKKQLTKFRLKIENSVEPTDTVTPLNCLTAFFFLRFFCPAILNPKLFYLTKNHQTGDVQRTLTLIAKILLTLANRSTFVEHKEPYLMSFNKFIEKNEYQVLEYFDKLTGRKLDFQPKILELSDDVTRPSLNIPKEILEELPTNPYLIDKYLRIVELIALLSTRPNSPLQAPSAPSFTPENHSVASFSSSEQLFKIHSLEEHGDLFSEFYESGDDDNNNNNYDENLLQADNFIKNLLQSSDDFDDIVKSHLKLQDLQNQAQLILVKTNKILHHLSKPELPKAVDWESFVDDVIERCVIDNYSKQILIITDPNNTKIDQTKYKLLSSGALKYKIVNRSPLKVGNSILRSSSMNTLKASESSKNPFKKLFGKKN